MTNNKRTIRPLTPQRRCQLAIGRILTNVRQFLQLEPTDELIALIEQHTALLNTLYKHYASLQIPPTPSVESSTINDHEEINVQTGNSQVCESLPADTDIPDLTEPQQAPPQADNITPVKRLPRKLKKQLAKLPPDHPMRLRYAPLIKTGHIP